MISINKKRLFNFLGIVVIAIWLVMMGLQIFSQKFNSSKIKNTYEVEMVDIESAQKEWKEIYLKDRKVGYSVSFIRPFKDGYYIQDEVFLQLNLMGFEKGIYAITQSNVDEKFILKDFVFKMKSGVVSYNISGVVQGNTLLVKTGNDKNKQNSSKIILSEPPVISSGMEHLFKTKKMKVGEGFRVPFFDPSTMVQKEGSFRVAARESIYINKLEYSVFRLEADMFGNTITMWVDDEGTILKEEGLMGLVMIKSSAANASMDIESGEEDFYDISAVSSDKEIPNLGRLTYLKLKLSLKDNIKLKDIPSKTERQNFENGIMMVNIEKTPLGLSNNIYSKNDDFKNFLLPEFNIESDEEEIINRSRAIIGDEKNPYLQAKKIMNWVYENLDKKPVVSIPSALEVLRTREGDCNEHATLLTALLRASAIPARISAGLVYNHGKFYYHAWTEAYLGQWITMDATLNQTPVDVSHLCFVYGNLDRQVELIGLIGRLKIEVLDFGYN
jgi:hypothetical protein